MLIIRRAAASDIETVHHLANTTWWDAYTGILSDEQIAFMLDEEYSLAALTEQFGELEFFITEQNGNPVAFAAIAAVGGEPGVFKLHKLYILPSEQGRGTGQAIIGHLEQLLKDRRGEVLELNVNRGNPALGFYQKLGFSICREADIPYHRFVLNDYVLRKELRTDGDRVL